MFNPFRAAEKVGSELIHDAIGQFEDIASRILAGVQYNREQITANNEIVAELQVTNRNLDAVAARGESVAAKLRELSESRTTIGGSRSAHGGWLRTSP